MKGEKERVRRRKEGQQRKAMVALLIFIIATLKIVFGPKKTVGSTQNVQLARMFSNIRLRIYIPGVLKTGLAKK